MSKKISIVIPVYNAMTSGGGYIRRCIESALNQHNFDSNDVEIIVINDGSKDGSYKVLQQIEKANKGKVVLIDQKNMGVARTRNKAIGMATGEYVTFLDQDDWLDEDFLSTMYGATRKGSMDVVISGYKRPNHQGKIVKAFQPSHTSYGRYLISAAWAKLHRTEFLRQNDIAFFDNSYGEDIPFTIKENLNTESYAFVDYIGYNWYLNDQSVSNTNQKYLTDNTVQSLLKLMKEIRSIKPAKTNRMVEYYMLRTVVFFMLYSGRKATKHQFMEVEKLICRTISGKNSMRTNLIPPRGELVYVAAIVMGFMLIDRLGMMKLFAYVWCTGK